MREVKRAEPAVRRPASPWPIWLRASHANPPILLNLARSPHSSSPAYRYVPSRATTQPPGHERPCAMRHSSGWRVLRPTSDSPVWPAGSSPASTSPTSGRPSRATASLWPVRAIPQPMPPRKWSAVPSGGFTSYDRGIALAGGFFAPPAPPELLAGFPDRRRRSGQEALRLGGTSS